MRNEWKNQIKVIGYLALIMLLLLSSLPLGEVFAEVNQDILDAYLFGGKETVTITRNDGTVINQGKGFLREYYVTLENYHVCERNVQANHLLQATYTVRQDDVILQSGNLIFGNGVSDSFQIEYTQIGEYTIEIKASAYEEIDGEYRWVSNKSLSSITDYVEKTILQLQGSIEKEGHFSYRQDYGRSVTLAFSMKEYQAESKGDICYTVSSSNEAVVKPASEHEVYFLKNKNANFVITGVGQAEITIQPIEHGFYSIEKLVFPITVENSTMRDEDYHILYTNINGKEIIFSDEFDIWKKFLEQKKNWLNGSISIQLSEIGEQSYAGFGLATSQGVHVKTEEKQLVLSDETNIQQYDFWCSNLQNNATTKPIEKGIRSFSVGIDRTAPENTKFTYNENAYEPTSNETTKYYGENFTISGSFQDRLSGVEYIEYTTQAELGEEAQWETIQNIKKDGTNVAFELILEQGIYTGIAVRATDIAGNVSEQKEIRSETGEYLTIIVDKTEPILDIMLKTKEGKAYQSNWTNQPITFFIQESPECMSLSGIQRIQYQYVSIGGEYQSDQWEEFPVQGWLEIGNDESVKTDQNGIYYFRAISNTGIITEVETQEHSAVRIRLQQTLPQKADIIEIAPKLEENQKWYNKKSGVPYIQFAYPKYDNGVDSKEYDAPITVHTRLTAKLSEEKEMTPVYKTALIGIQSDEAYQKLCLGEESENSAEKLEALQIDFAYDQQSGYAMDGIYELEYWISDIAGNESEHDIYSYQIDTHEPKALEVLIDGIPMEADTSQTIQYDRFYQSSVSGSASADFGVSGKGAIKLMVAEEVEDWERNTSWMQSDSFVLNPCTSGCIYMIAEDVAGNRAILRTQGIVVDNQPPTGGNGGKFFTITSKANRNHFYHNDVQVRFAANDLPLNNGFSALESFSCTIGSMGKENEQKIELFSFTKTLPNKEELAFAKSYTATTVIDAVLYEGNDTYVEIMAKDRCGNVSTSREVFQIDVTPPKVEIVFNQNNSQNNRYYSMERIATIHVQERNFDRKGIDIKITKDGTPYSISLSEWQSDGTDHWTTVAFMEDGDYTMSVSCTDMADNTSKEVYAQPFTIDLTKPVIEITYDNNTVRNEVYYQNARTAYITVKEHNFRKEDFVLEVEPQVLMSGWSHAGDVHSIQVSFIEDNHYYFRGTYKDLAGNKADSILQQEFYIDSIAPQIVICGVENESANAGEINPIVNVYDTNDNKEAVNIQVITGLGEKIPIEIQQQAIAQGHSYILTDMSQKEDNIYFLQIIALDMAGNKSELTYRFSLNRYGSTYDLSDVSQITKRVYNRSDQISDISIMEMNVDQIEDYSIYMTRNGKMLSCKETKERPTVQAIDDEICYYVETTESESTGYCNRYIFYQENFVKEGIYRLTCYSKDRAGNETNNTLEDKQAEIFFVVDNTVPKVMIDGIEEGGLYNEESKTVHIMVQDNFRLKEACFTLVNQAGDELQSWDYIELTDEVGDAITITIPSREEKQFLLYQVSDAAGNESVFLLDSQGASKGFLITTNPWLQFISSPIKVTGAIMIWMSIVAGSMGIHYRRRHRRKASICL